MGMELTATFGGNTPSWQAILTQWQRAGIPVIVRMIDGQLAFPDEIPGDDWKEIRVSTPVGMLTLRRTDQRIASVIWGNADDELVRHWRISAWACASAGAGRIATSTGEESAEEFSRSQRLFEA